MFRVGNIVINNNQDNTGEKNRSYGLRSIVNEVQERERNLGDI